MLGVPDTGTSSSFSDPQISTPLLSLEASVVVGGDGTLDCLRIKRRDSKVGSFVYNQGIAP